MSWYTSVVFTKFFHNVCAYVGLLNLHTVLWSEMSIDHVKSRPKCYCTSTCPIPLDDLKSNCTSGQLLPDLCGTCLICAKSRGQKCGGLNNQLGVCGVGLKCLVRFQLKRGSHGIQEENNATGTCVSDTSDLCPGKYLILQTKFCPFFHFSPLHFFRT